MQIILQLPSNTHLICSTEVGVGAVFNSFILSSSLCPWEKAQYDYNIVKWIVTTKPQLDQPANFSTSVLILEIV